MAFPTQVRCQYNVNALGTTPTKLATAMAAVPLDVEYLELLGLSLLSDVTAPSGTQAQRIIRLHLDMPPWVSTAGNNPQPKEYQGVIRSLSAKDTAGGSGARTVNVFYKDAAGVPHSNMGVQLNGEEWVALPTSNHALITDVQLATVGADQANDGVLQIATAPIETGPAERGEIVGQVPASFYTLTDPMGGDVELVRDFMLLAIESAMGMPIVPQDPVFS
jgi:hypothetical protein